MALSLILVLGAGVLAALSGLPTLVRRGSGARDLGAALAALAGLTGLVGAGMALVQGGAPGVRLAWAAYDNPVLALDALSAFFLIPVFLLGGLGPLYARGLPDGAASEREVSGLFWGLLMSGMTLLLISRHAMPFLLGWEFMALASFFLISGGQLKPEARRAGWLYLGATHVATLALFALFALWQQIQGSLALVPLDPARLGPGSALGLFLLALLAFGVKAGMMPLHIWLPPAHAAAPTHVSAYMSGVVIKMGIYGLLRVSSLMPAPPPAWGGLILLLGVVSSLLGVLHALGQHDLKRLLAWHSVENIGIILMGLGLALLGRSTGNAAWVVLGLGGALLHVWNHGLFKSLLFFGAGVVQHGAGTREIDRLGGLLRRMPWTAALFLVGAVAICGLPPLNGLVSELMVFLGLLHGVPAGAGSSPAVALAAPVLALVGALALACFIKVFGAVFLGEPRTAQVAAAVEAPWTMRLPMLILAACCLGIGLAPALVAPVLDTVTAAWLPQATAPRLVLADCFPLRELGIAAPLLAGLVALPLLAWSRKSRRTVVAPTWDCGYALPTPRMQTSASSLARTLLLLFNKVLHPTRRGHAVSEIFPVGASLSTEIADGVLDRLLLPAYRSVSLRLNWFHRFQQGLAQHYVLYIFIAVILLLGTLLPLQELKSLWLLQTK